MVLYAIRLHNIKEEKYGTRNRKTILTAENVKFLRAYHAAPPKARQEVRRLIAEDLRRKGDHEEPARLLSMKD